MTTSEGTDERGLPRVSRPALIAAAGTLLVFLVIAAASFEPFVRAQAERKARARGFDVRIEEVDLGWGGVWLKDVAATASAMPALKAELDAVFVPFGSAAIEVHGGEVLLSGGYDDVSAQWTRLRGSPASAGADSASSGRDYVVDGIALRWSGLTPGGGVQRAWGLGYRRGAGDEVASAELVRLFSAAVALEVRGFEASFRRQPGGRTLRGATSEALFLEVDAESLLSKRSGAVESSSAPTGGPAVPGARLPLLLAALSSATQKVLAENARIEVPAVRARLRAASDALNFGPSRLLVERKLGALHAVLEPGSSNDGDATPLALRLTLPLGPGEPQLELDGGPVSLAALGVREGDFGLFDVRRASVEAHTRLHVTAGPGLRISGSGSLRDVSLSRPALAPAPLRGIRVGWRGSAAASLDGSRVDVSDAELTIGDVRLQGSGLLERQEGAYRVKAEGGIPLAACEKLLDAAPQGFAPLLAGLRMSGTFSAGFAMDVDTRQLDRMKVELDVKNACVITHVPETLAPARFKGPWTRTVKGVDGEPLTIESGPGSAGWVPYDAISKHMETAVVVCEDGGFFRHDGFDYGAIEKSIKDNVRAGRFVRGASTISMQLAKNLYLGKEKTLSRKFEEAILTRLLEQQFQKQELMELYLNVIEYGPGIYGIGPAARHYFNVEPSQLTLGQSLYLASILPSPDRQHFGPDGAVSERWMKYLHKLMYIARKISRVSEEELAQGLEEQVAFRVPGAEPPALSEDLPPLPDPDFGPEDR